MFLASFHITVFINYVRLNCRIKFYLKTNNAFLYCLCGPQRQSTNNGFLKGRCHGSPVHLRFNFANYSPTIALELEVSKNITGKWRNQISETNKYISVALFLKLQAAGINFEKLFQSVSVFFSFAHSWHLLFLLCYFNLPRNLPLKF